MGSKNDKFWEKGSVFVGTDDSDSFFGGNFWDLLFGRGGDDKLFGGNGKDFISGGSGADFLKGGNGKDIILGDGLFPEYSRKTVDFTSETLWTGLAAHATSLDLPGLTLESLNGELYSFRGASVVSPNDLAVGQGWTKEVDAYNDSPEGLKLSFDKAQSSVSITLNQLYQEKLFSQDFVPEKVVVKIGFTDGTFATTTVQGVQTALPGELSFTLDSDDFGCKLISSVELTPDLATPPLPANISPASAASYNATHPYSEYTLKSVTYTRDANLDPGNDDKLCGGNGNDKLFGGRGNDKLLGGNGADLLSGGSGNNILTGGHGPDTFLFGFSSKGDDKITDFDVKTDHLKLIDGVTVSSFEQVGGDTVLHLSSGGDVTLVGVTKVSDWHILL